MSSYLVRLLENVIVYVIGFSSMLIVLSIYSDKSLDNSCGYSRFLLLTTKSSMIKQVKNATNASIPGHIELF